MLQLKKIFKITSMKLMNCIYILIEYHFAKAKFSELAISLNKRLTHLNKKVFYIFKYFYYFINNTLVLNLYFLYLNKILNFKHINK